MSCLDGDRLEDLISGRLAGVALDAAQAHVERCDSCRQAVESKRSGPDVTRSPEPGSESAEPHTLQSGEDLGRYMVLAQIGAGGMGLVYAAYDRTLDRRVALKQVRSDLLEADKRQEMLGRLVREARAMARLSHPNVVAVHDAFVHQGEFFVAMEFIDGETLRRWLRAQERSTEEILAVFFSAGAGLKAAHARGLVHRDFKPDNVLVGKDGRVCVTDFGLVLVDDGREPSHASSVSARPPPSRDPTPTPEDSVLEGSGSFSEPAPTRAGTLMGTPAYMPPEQRRGVGVDARTDQYSFCVSLFEALHGYKPSVGPKSGSRPTRRIPQHVKDALRRGMSERPADRYPSLEALLQALGRDPRARLRRVLLAGGAVAAVAGLAAFSAVRLTRPSTLCSGAPARVQAVWNREVKDGLLKAFSATEHAAAVGAFSAVAQTFEAYTAEWATHFKDACEATRVRGEQTEALMEARMACLDERLQALDALTHVFARADKQVVGSSIEASQALPPVAVCQRPPRFSSGVLPPPEAKQAQVAGSRKALAEAGANFAAGRYPVAAQLAGTGTEAAKALGYGPLTAEWLLLQGRTQERLGRYLEADESLYQTVRLAEQSGYQELVVRGRAMLMFVEGLRLEKSQEAQRWGELAAAALNRMGAGHTELEMVLAHQHGALLLYRGENAAALAELERAIALRTQLSGPDHVEIALALQNQSNALLRLGRTAEAAAVSERALKIREAAFGPQHIRVAESLNMIGTVLEEQGKFAEARTRYERAATIAEHALGPQSAPLATYLMNLGAVNRDLGAFPEAIAALERSLRIREGLAVGASTPVADVQMELGAMRLKQGRVAEAQELLQRAFASYTAARGEKDPYTGQPLLHLASVALFKRDAPAALSYAARGVPLVVQAFGEDNPRTAIGRGVRGQALLALGREKEAREDLEAAFKLLDTSPAFTEAAFVRFALAQVIWSTEGGRAVTLARKAAEDLERSYGEPERRELGRVREWLKSRRTPGGL